MGIITHLISIYLIVIVGFCTISCGYKTDPFWEKPEKQDLLLP